MFHRIKGFRGCFGKCIRGSDCVADLSKLLLDVGMDIDFGLFMLVLVMEFCINMEFYNPPENLHMGLYLSLLITRQIVRITVREHQFHKLNIYLLDSNSGYILSMLYMPRTYVAFFAASGFIWPCGLCWAVFKLRWDKTSIRECF
jgi:hypothetical protein